MLLRSKKPEDLQEANLLIQNMVKEVCHTDSYYTYFAFFFLVYEMV